MPHKLVAVEDIEPSKDRLLRVEWNLGKRCNFDCSYCGASTHDGTSVHLEWDVLERTVKKLTAVGRAQNKKVKLSLTGGEPYLHPRFIDFIKLAKAEGVSRVSVTTNGSVHSRLYKESLHHLDYLVVSYHLEYARREKVLQNIFEIKEFITNEFPDAGKNLHIHIMMLPGHFDEIMDVARQLRERDIHYVFRRVRPQFDAEGDYLRPYASGLVGQPRARKDLSGTYYSPEELKLMETLS